MTRRDFFRTTALSPMFEATGLAALDLGSRGGLDPWLLPAAWVTDAVGFEPDPVAFEHLSRQPSRPWPSVRWIPHAVGWEDGTATLHVPVSPEGASLLAHDPRMIDEFGHAALFTVARTVPVRTVTLDTLRRGGEIPACDYLKLDIEGAELRVLEAAPRALSEAVAVRLEAAFVEQRLGQPLVADVMSFLRGRGFVLADIADVHRWRSKPRAADPYVVRGEAPYSRARPVQCDLLFLRAADATLPPDAGAKLVVVSTALGFFDHASLLIARSPEVRALVERRLGRAPEAAMRAAAARYGRARALEEVRRTLRGLVPLVRSLLGGLPDA